MQAINLYVLTRAAKEFCTEFENTLAGREHMYKVKDYEYETIVSLVEELCRKGADISDLDGFYFSYIIEQIGTEFDLLKVHTGNKVLNIELKSDIVSEEKIRNQLIKNRYYLEHLAPNIYSFTYQQRTNQLYMLDGERLRLCTTDDLIEVLQGFRKYETGEISTLFRVADFLISPLNTPKKFLKDKYFLTNQQKEIKNDIIKRGIQNKSVQFWGITGSAGTGKTLLLYDIVKHCSKVGKCCVIHSGILCDGHEELNSRLHNVNIISAKNAKEEKLEKYQYIFVDEAQRIYDNILEFILENAQKHKITTVFPMIFIRYYLYQRKNVIFRIY